jgi:hypothetical protein
MTNRRISGFRACFVFSAVILGACPSSSSDDNRDADGGGGILSAQGGSGGGAGLSTGGRVGSGGNLSSTGGSGAGAPGSGGSAGSTGDSASTGGSTGSRDSGGDWPTTGTCTVSFDSPSADYNGPTTGWTAVESWTGSAEITASKVTLTSTALGSTSGYCAINDTDMAVWSFIGNYSTVGARPQAMNLSYGDGHDGSWLAVPASATATVSSITGKLARITTEGRINTACGLAYYCRGNVHMIVVADVPVQTSGISGP